MGNDGDYIVMCRAVLLMESAITGESRLWLANHALKYCQTNAEKIMGKGDYKSLLSVVKLYEEQRRSGLLLMIWFACIVGNIPHILGNIPHILGNILHRM